MLVGREYIVEKTDIIMHGWCSYVPPKNNKMAKIKEPVILSPCLHQQQFDFLIQHVLNTTTLAVKIMKRESHLLKMAHISTTDHGITQALLAYSLVHRPISTCILIVFKLIAV